MGCGILGFCGRMSGVELLVRFFLGSLDSGMTSCVILFSRRCWDLEGEDEAVMVPDVDVIL